MKSRNSIFIIIVIIILGLVAILPNFVFAAANEEFNEQLYFENKLKEHGGSNADIANTKKARASFSLPIPKVYSKPTRFEVSDDRPLKLFVNAGHGGNNTTAGKRTPAPETQEWYFNNAVASAFAAYIQKQYKNVEIMRVDREDKDVSLTERVSRANAWEADAYLSFHHNASTGVWNSAATGTETWRYPTSDSATVALAETVQGALLRSYGLRNRGVKTTAEFYELWATSMPAVIMEGAFMDSLIDIQKLRMAPGESNTELNMPVLTSVGREVADAIANLYGLEEKDNEEIELYEVAFDLNGASGEAPATITADEAGKIVSLPTKDEVPDREGYEFVGWTQVRDAEEIVSLPLTVTNNTTLYAKWQKIETPVPEEDNYVLTFDLNGASGTVPESITADANGKVDHLPTVTWTGYEFIGWTKVKDADQVVAAPLTLINNTTLYAKWKKIETPAPEEDNYVLSFDLNGASGEAPAAITADKNGNIASLPTKDEVPDWQGYEFVGWTRVRDGDQIVSLPLLITSSTTLYAKWQKIETPTPEEDNYVLSFDLNGASGEAPAAITADENGKVDHLPTVTWSGYEFIGWTNVRDEEQIVSLPLLITSNTTLYAKWQKIEKPEPEKDNYVLTFDLNEASGTTPAAITADASGKVDHLPTVTWSGYEFVGWTKVRNAEEVVSVPLTLTSNTTLYAKWLKAETPSVNKHIVKFDLNKGTGDFPDVSVEHNSLYKLPSKKPTKKGYLFAGWFTELTGGVSVPSEFTVTGDITLYAHWTEIVDQGQSVNNNDNSNSNIPKTGDAVGLMNSMAALTLLSFVTLFVSCRYKFNK